MINLNKKYLNKRLITASLLTLISYQSDPVLACDYVDNADYKKVKSSLFAENLDSTFLDIKILHFPTQTKDEFESFVNSIAANAMINEAPVKATQLMGEKLKAMLPQNILYMLEEMGRTGKPSIIHLKGLPIDSYIPLEGDIFNRASNKGKVSESLLLSLAYIMNCRVWSNPKEQEGRIIHNIAPVKGYEHTTSSRSQDPFYLHIENAYEENLPDFLILYGLVGDPKAQTSFYSIDNLWKSFPQHIIEEMKKPNFKIGSSKGYVDIEGRFSLLTDEGSIDQGTKIRLRLYQKVYDRIEPLTDKARETLDFIKGILEPVNPQGISIEAGEAIIFNNGWGINQASGVMHGRKGKIENPQRWLQRAFLFKNISK